MSFTLFKKASDKQLIAYHAFGRGLSGEQAKSEVVEKISAGSFIPGKGNQYSSGIYCFLTLDDTMKYGKNYGPYTLRFVFDASRFFIPNPDLALEIHGVSSQEEQLEMMGIDEDHPLYKAVKAGRRGQLLATIASEDKEAVDGLIMRTPSHGTFVVGFKPEMFKLTGWSDENRSEGMSFKQV